MIAMSSLLSDALLLVGLMMHQQLRSNYKLVYVILFPQVLQILHPYTSSNVHKMVDPPID